MSSFVQRKSGVGVCIESSELIALCRHRILHNKNEWMRLREAVLFTCKSCPHMNARNDCWYAIAFILHRSLCEKIYIFIFFTAALARLRWIYQIKTSDCIDIRWQKISKYNVKFQRVFTHPTHKHVSRFERILSYSLLSKRTAIVTCRFWFLSGHVS